MKTTYNTKLTAEQKQDLKYYNSNSKTDGTVIVYINGTTIAMFPDGYGKYYIGKAVASKREQKLRAKVGMLYALERAHDMNRIVSARVYNQIIESARHYNTAKMYGKNEETFEVVRYL